MPKKDEKKSSERGIKKLWWGYLKNSPKFEEFCQKRHELGADYFGEYYSPFIEYLKYFGNIFEQEFDDWWDGERRNRWRSLGSRPVLDLRDSNSYHGLYFDSLRKQEIEKGTFPRPENIWEIIQSEPQYIFLAVPVVGQEDMAIIAEQIKKIRNCYKKTATVREADKHLRRFTMPSTRIRYDELQRYLDVYDLHKNKGLKMAEVMKEIVKKKQNVNVALNETEFFHYQSKAKKIIENVEKGYFPGKY